VLTGRYDEALELCDRVINRNAGYLPVLLTQSRALRAKGKYNDAKAAVNDYLSQASSVSEENTYLVSNGLINKAEILLQQGRFDEAMSAANSALVLNPAGIKALFVAAKTKLATQKQGGLNSELNRMRRLVSAEGNLDGRWYIHYLEGELALRQGEYTKATGFLRQALLLNPPERNFYHCKLAETYSKSGDDQKAMEIYREVLGFNPNYTPAALGMARIYEQQGNHSQARRSYRHVMKILDQADVTCPDRRFASNRYAGLTVTGNKK
jgi:tetratricopeptide (TPR) repeat protein